MILIQQTNPALIQIVTRLRASVIRVDVQEILAEENAILTIVMAAMLVAFVILMQASEGAVGAVNGVVHPPR